MTVRELIALGRHPHQGFLGLPTRRDADAIEAAIRLTGLGSAAGRMLHELSGGEQQRAWFALVLAQEPEILLLDEPTTFLDLANQMVVLELIEELNRLRRISVVMALHDLGQAARYARRLVLLRDGSVLAEGTAAEVLTKERIRDAYGVEAEIVRGASGVPTVVPLRAIRPA